MISISYSILIEVYYRNVKNIFNILHVISISCSILIEVCYRESTGDTDFLL